MVGHRNMSSFFVGEETSVIHAYYKLKSDITAKIYSSGIQVQANDIEDIVQDVAIKLFLSADKYDNEKGRVSTFRDHIIVNALLDRIRYWRTKKNQIVATAKDIEESRVLYDSGGYKEVEFEMDFELFFDTLTPIEQKIVAMCLEGKRNTVIAKEFKLSDSSITRYRKIIREKWNRFFALV